MSLASLLKQNFLEGGPFFMTLHYIMWILVIVFAVKFLMNYYSKNKSIKRLTKINTTIIFIGGFGSFLAIFYQNMGFYGALTAIERAQDISPTLILGGLRVCTIIFIFSFFNFRFNMVYL